MKNPQSFTRSSRVTSHLRTVTASTLILAAAAMAVFAASPAPKPGGGSVRASSSFKPRSLSEESTIVVVQLSGKSVAEAQAEAGHRKLTKAEKDQIKNQLKGNQDSIKPQIHAAGGTVLAHFQSALNGVKVRIPASKVDKLATLPGVIAVLPVHNDVPDNATSVPYIGAPTVWDTPTNYRGEGIKVAIIDTGIDYTHANFGGPGTVAAYNAANATDTAAADPSLFGPAAPRVKGGFDLVGDAYTGSNTPASDPNPLDCNGHGSHVAGTAAGSGVTSGGATYTGPYNASIYTPNAFRIGPGVAPKADIYSYRVFGCTGSTNVTVDAINMAVDADVDVINMSLGSPFGTANDASAVAATNATNAGVIVLASSGNNGANPYITGAPAAGTGAISVAANDATGGQSPGAIMAISTDGSITALNANGATFADGNVLPVAVLRTSYPNGPVSLGCQDTDYTLYPGGVAGKLVVTARGTCSRVGRAIRAERFGAAAAAMLNTDSGYPPFEGQITSDPDTGFQFTVTIPFFGIRGVLGPGATTDPDNLITADPGGGTVTLTNTVFPSPGFSSFASFSSRGPRTGDSWLKPDITAPGVGTVSTGVGTGNGAATISGTSMASPHVAGVAALVKQAHPTWNQVQEWKAAIVNTGNPSAIGGLFPYRTSRGGTGLVQPVAAVNTNVIALGDPATSTLNFGFSELKANFNITKQITLRNKGSSAATFKVSQTNAAGSTHSIALGSKSVTIPAGTDVTLNVTLKVPVTTAGDSSAFREVAGLITLTPATASDNNNVALRVPYYLVPRALSNVTAKMATSVKTASPSTNATLSNPSGPLAGDADFYAWGISSNQSATGASNDVRAVGVQSFPGDGVLVFAVNTWRRWSNAATNEFDIGVDVDGDDNDDYVVVGLDFGILTSPSFNGQMAVAVFNLHTGSGAIEFLATAPSDGSTVLLPVLFDQLCDSGAPCLSASSPRFTYHITSFDIFTGGSDDVVPGKAKFNAFSPSISTGAFVNVPKSAKTTVPISINPSEWGQTPALGEMIVTFDNPAGAGEAALLPLTLQP